jgi:hypothetical protein
MRVHMKIKLHKFLRKPHTRHKTQHISTKSNIQGIDDAIAKLQPVTMELFMVLFPFLNQ